MKKTEMRHRRSSPNEQVQDANLLVLIDGAIEKRQKWMILKSAKFIGIL